MYFHILIAHATGAAFDIELWDEQSDRILLTKVPERFGRDYLETKANLSENEIEVRDNRRLLHNLLTTNAILSSGREFIPHPFEYWHYSRNEKLACVFASLYGQTHKAFYQQIDHLPSE